MNGEDKGDLIFDVTNLQNFFTALLQGGDSTQYVTVQVPDLSSLFANLNLLNWQTIVSGVNAFLDSLEDMFAGKIFGQDIPVLGDALKSVFGTDNQGAQNFIRDLKRDFNALLGNGLATALSELDTALTSALAPVLKGPADSAVKVFFKMPGDAGYTEFNGQSVDPLQVDDVRIDINLGSVMEIASGIGFDIGLPGLGLKVDEASSVTFRMAWGVALSFGIDRNRHFYIRTDQQNEVSAEIFAGVGDQFSMLGELGFLQLALTEDTGNDVPPSGVRGTLGIDLRGGGADGKLYLATALSDLDVAVTGALVADIDFNARLGIGFERLTNGQFGDSSQFPSIVGELRLHFNVLDPNDFSFGLNDLRLNFGEFVNEFLGPVVRDIQKVLEPVKPLIDFLRTPIPILSDFSGDPVTILTLASQMPELQSVTKFIEAVGVVSDIASLVGNVGDNVFIEIGDFNFGGFNLRLPRGVAGGLPIDAGTQTAQFASFLTNARNSMLSSLGGTAWASIPIQPDFGISVPFIQNPASLLGLLFGQTVDLIEIDLPTFSFPFQFPTITIPVYPSPPITLGFTGSLEFRIDLAFGYDSFGLQTYLGKPEASRNLTDLMLGFYISDDPRNTGGDPAEITMRVEANLTVALDFGIVAAGVTGGIFATIGLNLHDVPDASGKTDGKLRGNEIIDLLNQGPICIFDAEGGIGFNLDLTLRFGIGPFSVTVSVPLIPDTTIVSFTAELCGPPPQLATLESDGTLKLNIGDRSAYRNHGTGSADDNANDDYTVRSLGNGLVQVESGGIRQTFGQKSDDPVIRRIVGHGGGGNDRIVVEGALRRKDGESVEMELDGGAGDDELWGSEGNDILTGGSGRDRIYGQGGNDRIAGNSFASAGDAGEETDIDAGTGDDVVYGVSGRDRITGGEGNDLIFGGAGSDDINGGVGIDRIFGGAGNDLLVGDLGDDRVYGGAGNDLVVGGAGRDRIFGDLEEAFNDATATLLYGAPNVASEGDDVMFGDRYLTEGDPAAYAAQIQARMGTDANSLLEAIYAHSGDFDNGDNDVINANGGADLIFDDYGDDQISAGAGNDVVFSGRGTDTIYGEAGNDDIRAGSQRDFVYGGEGNDTIFGGSGDDELRGEAGLDIIDGESGLDLIFGGLDADTIRGGTGVDTIYGDSGNDDIHGQEGNDIVDGGDGNDALWGDAGNDTLLGQSGDDTLRGGTGNDLIYGHAGLDVLYGEDGDDTIDGGSDRDLIFGNLGNDILYGRTGNDQIDGGGGRDRIEGNEGDDLIFGRSGDDTISGGTGADEIWGGTENDTIAGDAGNDRIYGEAGDDLINGGTENDVIFAGTGADRVFGDEGNDEIWGEAGADRIEGGAGLDAIHGGDDNDLIFGQDDADTIWGDAGLDEIHGGSGDDTVFGGTGRDLIFGDLGGDTLRGEEDVDTIEGGAGDDFIFGDAALDRSVSGFDDILLGQDGNDYIEGNGGNDLIFGHAGNDTVYAGSGHDRVFGDDGTDTLFGEDGDDLVEGGEGADAIDGGAGRDVLRGQAGADSILGGSEDDDIDAGTGDDTVDAGSGDDLVLGGAGNDVIDAGAGQDIVRGGEGRDTIRGGDGNDKLFADSGIGDRLEGGDGDDEIHGSDDGADTDADFNDALRFGDVLTGGAGHDVIYAYGGADDIDGGDGYDFIDAGAGSDRIAGGLGRDRIEGGLGDDLIFGDLGDGNSSLGDDDIIFGGLGNDTIRAGGGADRVHGGFGTDTIFGDDGDDTLFADYGGGTIRGGAGDDIITGADDDADLLFGDAGRDRLFGLAGNDQITGGAGDDIVDAGAGDDTIEGGLGRDLLIGGFGHDTLYGHQADGLGDDNAPDMLYGDSGAGAAAGDGNDRLFGGGGNDHMFGEGGIDFLNAGAGVSDVADTSENAAYAAGTPTALPVRVAETRFGAADAVNLPQAVPSQGFWVDLAGPSGLSLVGTSQSAADADGFVQLASGALVRGDGSIIPSDYAILLGRGSTLAGDGSVRPGDGSAVPGDGAILAANGISTAFAGQSFADGMAGSSSIVAGADGQYVAWVDPRGGASEIYVARLSGGVWNAVGGSVTNGGISASVAASTQPSIALDASGAVVVAWIEATGDGRTQVNCGAL